MRDGKVEQAAALAVKIGEAIRNFNTAELSRVDVLSDPRSMWSKVRQLTGRSKTANTSSNNSVITADVLNKHYAAISTDANYTAPSVKSTVNNWQASCQITDWQMFDILDKLRPTNCYRPRRHSCVVSQNWRAFLRCPTGGHDELISVLIH